MKKTIIVDEKNYYSRLDKFIRNSFPEVKLGSIFKIIRKGDVKINGKRVKKNDFIINIGDEISIVFPQNEDIIRPLIPSMKPRKVDFEIIFENDDFLVINKPPKISMHPGSGEQMATVIEGLIYRADGKYEPHLVHRLDKLTSGVLLAAKNKQTTRELSEIIKSNSSEKYYKTLVYGVPKMKKAFIESVVDGKEAILEYETEKIFNTSLGRFSLVDINLITGRKHQIRVQFSGKNLPVLGDDYYGDKEINKLFRKNFGLKRFFLHAYKMKFQFKDKKYTFTADLYKDLSEVLKRLEFSESGD